MIKKNCMCCRKKLKNAFSTTKYCTSCSLHTKEYRTLISGLKRRLKLLRIKHYGVENGQQRIR